MLKIRAAQIEALQAAARKRFEDNLHAHLLAAFPNEVKALKLPLPGIRSLLELIRHGITRAAAYGLTAERDVARFIELLVRVEPTFENRRDMAWATTLLKNPSLTPRARIELVLEMLPRKMPQLSGAPAPVSASNAGA